MAAGKPWNDEPKNLPESWSDLAADYRRSAEWARKEASGDDCHPNDRNRYEDEAAQWSLAAAILDDAAGRLTGALGGRTHLRNAAPAPSWDKPAEQDAEPF